MTAKIGFNVIRVFHKLNENANIGIKDFTAWKQKNPVTKCHPQ